MNYSYLKSVILIFLSSIAVTAYASPEETLSQKVQLSLNHYLANQGKKEGATGLAVTISLPGKNQGVNSYVAGKIGYPPLTKSVTVNNLWEVGSITKSFTAAMILQLQAEGVLSIDDKIGRWLPQYPQWKDISIRQLLSMISNIPSYTENNAFINKIYGNIRTNFTDKELLAYSYPDKPIQKSLMYHYSNTNYILAGLIIEAVTKNSFAEELNKRLLIPFNLKNTYYVAGKNWKSIREDIMPRMTHGYYYDDKTKKMVDATDSNMNWAGPAGAIISDTQDITTWVHILYHGLFVKEEYRKKTLSELESVVSMRTGKSISDVSAADPRGFGLGVGKLYLPQEGRFWVYQGSGMGFRMMYFFRQCNDISVVAALNSKGGENGAPTAVIDGGNHIEELITEIYNAIIAEYPEYNCKN